MISFIKDFRQLIRLFVAILVVGTSLLVVYKIFFNGLAVGDNHAKSSVRSKSEIKGAANVNNTTRDVSGNSSRYSLDKFQRVREPTVYGGRKNVVTDALRNFENLKDATAAIHTQLSGNALEVSYAEAFLRSRCKTIVDVEKLRGSMTTSTLNPNQTNALDAAQRKLRKRNAASRCEGWNAEDLSDDAIKRLWNVSASAGDTRAQAILMDIGLRAEENVASKIKLPDGKELTIYRGPTVEQTHLLLSALGSKDASFIASLGPLLEETFADVDFVFGPQAESVEFPANLYLWDLVSCHFGADCGVDNATLVEECANRAICNEKSLEDYLRKALSAEEWSQLERLVPIIVNAINTGDWSDVVSRRSPPPKTGNPTYTIGTRRF